MVCPCPIETHHIFKLIESIPPLRLHLQFTICVLNTHEIAIKSTVQLCNSIEIVHWTNFIDTQSNDAIYCTNSLPECQCHGQTWRHQHPALMQNYVCSIVQCTRQTILCLFFVEQVNVSIHWIFYSLCWLVESEKYEEEKKNKIIQLPFHRSYHTVWCNQLKTGIEYI